MKNRKGFTLIELLAVIIILGILMIIAIPSVTRYISDSRKNAYVDTAKEIISGARNLVNEGKLEMYDTNTTYYIPTSCIKTENASKSPYGDFTKAYIGVVYDGKGYKYYWISVDDAGQGVKNITQLDQLDIDDIESDLKDSDIEGVVTTTGIGNRSEIKILNCTNNNWDEQYHIDDTSNNVFDESENSFLAYSMILNNSSNDLYNIPSTNIYIFRGANPNNYVKFNGDELWRVVGVYGNKIKLIRNEKKGYYQYNSSNNRRAEWVGSSLEIYLNNETEGGYYYNLSSNAKEMISTGSWDVGMTSVAKTAYESYLSSITEKYSAKIGMLTLYEFAYATTGENCYNVIPAYYYEYCGLPENNWLTPNSGSYWTISHYNDGNSIAAASISSIGFATHATVDNILGVNPAVILKSNLKIIEGSGTENNPYVLS